MGLAKHHQWARGPWRDGIYHDVCRKCGGKWHDDTRSMLCAMRMSNRVLKNLRRQRPTPEGSTR